MATKSIISNAKMHTLAQAISAKGGASLPMTVDQMAAAVAAIPTGGGGPSAKSIFFIDYDGSILHSYGADEFSAMADLPANPSHSGLIAQGWNWTKAGIEAQLAAYPEGVVWVGQKYITDDGKTRIYVHFEEDRHSPYLGIGVNGTVEVDWGDGSATDTLTGTFLTAVQAIQHVYAAAGDYVITLTVLSGSFNFIGASSISHILKKNTGTTANTNKIYANAVKRIEIGRNAGLGDHALYNCFSLTSITIPDEVTGIGDSAFSCCYLLKSVTIPDRVTSIGNYIFSNCYMLTNNSLPESVTSIGSGTFYNCYSLASVTIPGGVTSIGGSVFNYCTSLNSITIPDGVTSIGGSAFSNCYSLTNIKLSDRVTSIGSNAFAYCYALADISLPEGLTNIGSYSFTSCYSLKSITIPHGVTSIEGNTFYYCHSLEHITLPEGLRTIKNYAFGNCESLVDVTIPDGVTSIGGSAFNGCSSLTEVKLPDGVTSIKNYTLNNCYSLASVTIPDGVTSIEAYAFANCSGVAAYHILPETPPTLANTNAFVGIESDCIIYVPAGTLAAYQAATNWSTYASYMREAAA